MRTTTILTAAALLAALTACSSSTDDNKADDAPTTAAEQPSTTPTPAAAAALEQAIRDYTAALFSGDARGYDHVSARCRRQMTKGVWVAMAEEAHQQYGSQKATGIHVDQLSGDLARVSYGAGKIPQFEREGQSWTREGGTWRWDACPSTS